jgi:hypothetical protein
MELGPRPSDPALNTVGDRYSGPGYGPVGQGTIGVGNPIVVTPGPPPAQVRIYIQGNNLIILDNDTGNVYAVPLAVALDAQPSIYSPTK